MSDNKELEEAEKRLKQEGVSFFDKFKDVEEGFVLIKKVGEGKTSSEQLSDLSIAFSNANINSTIIYIGSELTSVLAFGGVYHIFVDGDKKGEAKKVIDQVF